MVYARNSRNHLQVELIVLYILGSRSLSLATKVYMSDMVGMYLFVDIVPRAPMDLGVTSRPPDLHGSKTG